MVMNSQLFITKASHLLYSESQAIGDENSGINALSTPAHGIAQKKAHMNTKRKEKVMAIGEQTSHLYPHRVKVYPENTDPRKIYKSRAIGVPRRPDFSISDSDSDSDSDNDGTGPLNELHTKMVQYKADEVKKFASRGLPVKTGKWDVLENKTLEKRLKKIARVRRRYFVNVYLLVQKLTACIALKRRKMSFEDVQNSFFSEPFAKDREFWWSLGMFSTEFITAFKFIDPFSPYFHTARAFPQRTIHNIVLHTKRIFDENNYQGQWDEESDAKLLA
jgi:hypothetical protein